MRFYDIGILDELFKRLLAAVALLRGRGGDFAPQPLSTGRSAGRGLDRGRGGGRGRQPGRGAAAFAPTPTAGENGGDYVDAGEERGSESADGSGTGNGSDAPEINDA